jgi:prolipoprotein diacylglyceryltransferase
MILIMFAVIIPWLQSFADNAKLYCNINTENASSLLQKSLDNLAIWAIIWAIIWARKGQLSIKH